MIVRNHVKNSLSSVFFSAAQNRGHDPNVFSLAVYLFYQQYCLLLLLYLF